MKTTEQGRRAEAAVAKYLIGRGFKILAQNWRRPRCEVDIITIKKSIIYFVEVKYRGSGAQGDGFEYVTPKKQNQVEFAARVWAQENKWSGDYRLMAAAVGGDDCARIDLIELS